MAPTSGAGPLPISIVIPTIGRPALLQRCLESIASCRPGPAEILVVDQSGGVVADVVASHRGAGARLVPCDARGIAAGTNLGLQSASQGHVLVTHDDCTVAVDWVAVASRHARDTPRAIITGRVLPGGDPAAVPSTKVDETRYDFTGMAIPGQLYPANMLLPRDEVLGIGGFDERDTLRVAAEDNDLCYRWLRGGRSLAFEPDLVVWHHDWRSHDELARLYVNYGRGQGAFYAKHLAAGDVRILRFLAYDVRSGVRSVFGGVRHRRPRWSDPRRGMLRGLPEGLVAGFVESRRLRKTGQNRR